MLLCFYFFTSVLLNALNPKMAVKNENIEMKINVGALKTGISFLLLNSSKMVHHKCVTLILNEIEGLVKIIFCGNQHYARSTFE